MIRSFLTASTIFLVFILWYSLPLAQEFTGPKLVIKEQEFNFKEVMEGKVIEHTFQVLNQGDKPLKIINIKPG